jgi:hypothetical protein
MNNFISSDNSKIEIAQYFAFKTEEALVWFKLRWL